MDIEKLVIELIAKVGDLDVSEIKKDSLLVDDLSMDSLMFLDFVTQIEAKANSVISPKEMTQIKTVQDVINLVIKNRE
ncbi:acyl carrier protein [Ruminiclostridium josui]|uniref:acyl carrier protein n=1 Tax=Ruminiclostridium josui TaxID=1499 RepID=UPI0004AE5A30|nr:phosphopantetheine-binding protein [Ruminiclostridium josui]